MTTVLLVRHAMCDPVGRVLAGRAPGVHLNRPGSVQAAALGAALGGLGIAAVYSSPLERAVETAAPLAHAAGVPVRVSAGLLELDFGQWTGREMAELESDPLWRAFNLHRATTRIPGGETMEEVVARAARAVEDIRHAHEGGLVAAVSHGDVIRALLAHYAGMSLDHLHRLEVAPASVSALAAEKWGTRLLSLNWRVDGPV